MDNKNSKEKTTLWEALFVCLALLIFCIYNWLGEEGIISFVRLLVYLLITIVPIVGIFIIVGWVRKDHRYIIQRLKLITVLIFGLLIVLNIIYIPIYDIAYGTPNFYGYYFLWNIPHTTIDFACTVFRLILQTISLATIAGLIFYILTWIDKSGKN